MGRIEEIFSLLGHSARLWIVLYILDHGPTRQVELGQALEDAKVLGQRNVGSGEVSQLVRPLLAAGLLRRDRPRGPIRLANAQQIRHLISIASAVSVAVADDSSEEAGKRHSELMRRMAAGAPAQDADSVER